MHRAVAGDPAHSVKRIRLYFHDKMTLSPLLVTGMATMTFAIVDHVQGVWLKRGVEPIMNFLCHGHFFL